MLRSGEALGIIGANGSGKSTLLKVLAGLLTPRGGAAVLSGKVEAIIELGAGLDDQLTGRENCRLASLLRRYDAERAAAYEEDVQRFAALTDSFDTTVGTYSSGTRARLAFALAAMARPDILLIDEALAVGDHSFQRQCVRFIQDFLANGGAMVLVSHSTLQVQLLCQRAILLADGQAAFEGTAVEAVRAMVEGNRRSEAFVAPLFDEPLRLLSVAALDGGVARAGEPAEVVIEYRLHEPVDNASWGFELWTADEQICIAAAQDMVGRPLAAGLGTLRCLIDPLPLTGGRYVARVNITDFLTGSVIALGGFAAPNQVFEVQAAPSPLSNYDVAQRSVVVLEVKWPD